MINIGIPIRNGFQYVSKLLHSIDKYTSDIPLEKIILIDDGSSIKAESLFDSDKYKIIRNEKSMGFPAACNQILRESKGVKYVCILNSDTLVSPRWLFHLYNAAERNDEIGIIGPSTSYANDPQCRRDICGRRFVMSEAEIVKYAAKLERIYAKCEDIGSVLTGFCMLIRMEAINKVGFFDEQFGLGSFEEADMCKRMINAGYKCFWAPYSYVHHYGKGTFGMEKIDWKRLWQENQKRFEEKWKEN